MEALTLGKVVDALFYVCTGVLAYLLNSYSTRIKRLEEDLTSTKLALPEKYVQKNDMKDFEERVISSLNRIEDKLDSKQDK